MYKLTKVDNYFIAISFCAIVIPRCFSDNDSFEVLISLFYFKVSYLSFSCLKKNIRLKLTIPLYYY